MVARRKYYLFNYDGHSLQLNKHGQTKIVITTITLTHDENNVLEEQLAFWEFQLPINQNFQFLNSFSHFATLKRVNSAVTRSALSRNSLNTELKSCWLVSLLSGLRTQFRIPQQSKVCCNYCPNILISSLITAHCFRLNMSTSNICAPQTKINVTI